MESGGGARFCVEGKEEIGFYWDRGDALIFLFKSDMNSNADDADDADFALPAAKFFLHKGTKTQRHKVPQIENGFWYGFVSLCLCVFVSILVSSRRRRDKNPRKSAQSASSALLLLSLWFFMVYKKWAYFI